MQINYPVNMQLPSPWSNVNYRREQWGAVNFLVGPNGSGKTQFATKLRETITPRRCSLLGADRLSGTTKFASGLSSLFVSNHASAGFDKSKFTQFKSAAKQGGFGLDAFILLSERPDLRIRLQATLSQVFKREIRFEWNSGRLIPKASLSGSGEEYTLHQEECHGLKELVVLLTHLYNNASREPWLIIDEPELNLHPQYQAFLMSEIRAIAGRPDDGKKIVVLITHSPFILDIQSLDDLRSVIAFDSDFSVPKSVVGDDHVLAEFVPLLPRLNSHHKQLFFASDPVLVEGIHDQRLLSALQSARAISMEGAGSGFVDTGGKDEVAAYYRLLRFLGKKARFLLDLDAVFEGRIRRELPNDSRIVNSLIESGLGRDVQAYIGALEQALRPLIESARDYAGATSELVDLRDFIRGSIVGGQMNWPRCRVAMMIHLNTAAETLHELVDPSVVADCQARRNALLLSLEDAGVYILPGGALENYLPSYNGSPYRIAEELKRTTVENEITWLAQGQSNESLSTRYGDLITIVAKLPGAEPIDIESALKLGLSEVVFAIQRSKERGLISEAGDIPSAISEMWASYSQILQVRSFASNEDGEYECVLEVADCFGIGKRLLSFNRETSSAAFRSFVLELAGE